LDRQIVQFIEEDRAAVETNEVLGRGQLGGAGRENQILQVQRVGHIDGRELLGVELVLVEVDHDGTALSAERIRYGGSLHGAERCADEVVGQIEDLLLAQGLTGEAELQDGDAGGIVLEYVGGEHAGRHLAKSALHGSGDLRHRHVDLDVGMEIDSNHRVAVVRLRLDVLDI